MKKQTVGLGTGEYLSVSILASIIVLRAMC